MNLIYIIAVGSIIGWVSAKVINHSAGAGVSIIIGITGAFVASVIMMLFLSNDYTYLDFTWWGALWSLAGATILSIALNLSEKPSELWHRPKDRQRS